jgi:hypothetical protein
MKKLKLLLIFVLGLLLGAVAGGLCCIYIYNKIVAELVIEEPRYLMVNDVNTLAALRKIKLTS